MIPNETWIHGNIIACIIIISFKIKNMFQILISLFCIFVNRNHKKNRLIKEKEDDEPSYSKRIKKHSQEETKNDSLEKFE